MKKFISILLAITIILTTIIILPLSASAANINIGDYIVMGTYYGQPILWRCVDIDENGPLMLSDRILCLKAFDASGTNTKGSHRRGYYYTGKQGYWRQSSGSNYWADSNIRDWLNSDASAGNVVWSCGNPPDASHVFLGYNAYNNEAGFLSNFSAWEQSAIKTVTQKSLLDGYEHSTGSSNTRNPNYHIYYSSISDVVQNYATAYSEQVTDKMFLLDVKQINTVYNNRSTLGDDYYIGIPTEEAVKNSEYKSSSLTATDRWWSWLRSPFANYDSSSVRYVYLDGDVYYSGAGTGAGGVRPAFYLNLSSLNLSGGAGTYDNPYTIKGGTQAGINSKSSEGKNIVVYCNKNKSWDNTNDYMLCADAKIEIGSKTYTTDKNGGSRVSIPQSCSDSVTVSKDGFVTRNMTTERLRAAGKVYLQQYEEKPIINAVYAGDTDVMNDGLQMDLTSDEEVTLKADVAWNGGERESLYLVQDSRRAEFSGDELTIVLKSKFDISKSIYIVAVDSWGNKTAKKLKFDASGGTGALSDYKLNFGDMIGGTLPDSLPAIGGMDIKLDIPMLPISVTFEDNKFYGVLGLDVAKYSDNYSTTENKYGNVKSKHDADTKFLAENIKDSIKKSAGSWSANELKKKWKKAMYSSTAKFGFDADLTVLGYIEGYIDSNGKAILLDGGVTVNPSVKVSLGSQLPPPVTFLYWDASVKGEIEATVNLYLSQTAKNFMPSGSIGGKVTVTGGLGIGARGVIGAEGGPTGNLGLQYDIYMDAENYFAVKGGIGAYAKAYIGPLEFRKDWSFVEGTIWDHPSSGTALLSIDEMTPALVDRSYGENQSEFKANDIELSLSDATPQNKTEYTFKTNVYTQATPQLLSFADGKMLAVWTDDDKTRSDINRTALYWSYYNGAVWSDPVQVEDNGTADFSPELKLIDNKAYLVWIDAKSKLSDSDINNIEKVYSGWEIKTAEFNGSGFTDINKITDNNNVDFMPSIFGDGDNVSVVWVTQSNNNLIEDSGTNTVMIKSLTGGSATSYAQAENIDKVTGAYIDGDRYIAYSAGTTKENKEVYLNKVRLTENNVIDSKPCFDGNKLYWYSDGGITEYSPEIGEGKNIIEGKEEITNDRFSVISDNNGNKCIAFEDKDNLVQEISAYIYDASSDKWGDKLRLSDFKQCIFGFSGIELNDGTMKFLVNKRAVTGNNENPYGQADLSLFTVSPSYNIAIKDVMYDRDMLIAGNTLEFNTEIENKGELTVDEFVVNVCDEAGTVIASSQSEEPLLPGETVEFIAKYPLGDDEFVPHNVVLSLEAVNCDDYDLKDNTYKAELSYNNISVEDVLFGINEDGNGVIHGNIVNRGYNAPSKVRVSLREGTAEGKIAETKEIPFGVELLGANAVEFEVPYEEGKVYYLTLDDEDMFAGDDSGFVILAKKENGAGIIVDSVEYDKGVVAAEATLLNLNGSADAYLAIYEGDRLVGVGREAIPENSEKITAYANAELSEDKNYTVKLFVWDGNMKPLVGKYSDELIVSKHLNIDTVLESSHPYSNNIDETKSYTYDGSCESIDITFSEDTETESRYDYIYIYDKDDNQIGKYSGTSLSGTTINISGNTVKIRLTSDGSNTYYGFKTESIVVNR